MGNLGWYLGSDSGDVFRFDSSYTGDNSNSISTQYVSRRLDFLDQIPNSLDRFKSIYGAKLTYIDKGSVSVTVSISADGGTSWTSDTNTVGTAGADGAVKTSDFHFIVPGQYFNVKIAHSGSSGSLEWIQLELKVDIKGEHFDIS